MAYQTCDPSTPAAMVVSTSCCLPDGSSLPACGVVVNGGAPLVLSDDCPGCPGEPHPCTYEADGATIANCDPFNVP
jgi:hypothetical protein